MISRICRTSGLMAAMILLLSGCSVFRGIFVGSKGTICPVAAVLVDTSSLTVFRPELQNDPAGALYAVDLNGVKTDCSFDRREGQTDSSLHLTFHATRAPTGEAVSYSVPYYVAVTQGDRILSKRILTAQFGFAPGASTANFEEDVDSTVIELENGKQPYDYELLVGLQLTPAQHDYNKKMGRFAQ
jgi:hypothetical protein